MALMIRCARLSCLLATALSACASQELQAVQRRMASLRPVVVDERLRAELREHERRTRRQQEAALGVRPGPSTIRFPYRCGVLAAEEGARIAVRLHPEFLPPDPYPLIVPGFVNLLPQSDEPYEAGKIYLDYSGPPTEVLLLEVVGRHAIGFVVEDAPGRELEVGDEAWCGNVRP